jgi:hypothetical protein
MKDSAPLDDTISGAVSPTDAYRAVQLDPPEALAGQIYQNRQIRGNHGRVYSGSERST